MSCGKNRFLHSKSRSQQVTAKLQMSVNVLDDIFWTRDHFVTKLGIVMQHHEPEGHAKNLVHCLQCQGHSAGLHNQNMTMSTIYLLNCWSIATNLGFIVQHQKPEHPMEKKWITAFKVKVTAKVQNVSECLSRWYRLNCRRFCYQTWYGYAASWARVSCGKIVHCLQGHGHSEGSYDQNTTFYYIF